MTSTRLRCGLVGCGLLLLGAGCGGAGSGGADSGGAGSGGAGSGGADAGGADAGGADAGGADAGGADAGGNDTGFDPLVPPADETQMAEWLDAFDANSWEDEWVCEATATDKSDQGAPGIHVHSAMNRVCNNPALADASLSGTEQLPVGVAAIKFIGEEVFVEVKVDEDSDGGQGWYWYAPSDGVAARGAFCIGCHGAAGSDEDHPGLGDYVYFQVER